MTFSMDHRKSAGHLTASNEANASFWDQLHNSFRTTLKLIHKKVVKHGIDLNSPELRASVAAKERAERRAAAKHKPLTNATMSYHKAVDQWLKDAKPLFESKISELNTQVNLEIGDPGDEARRLSDYTDVIQWYQPFIHVKVSRAISSRASEEIETDETMRQFPRDSDGSAKVALIAMDRSIAAWAALRESLGEDSDAILDLLAQLAVIRRDTEALFPAARAFVRPGFDETELPPGTATKKSIRTRKKKSAP
jgi:hypothetical protein